MMFNKECTKCHGTGKYYDEEWGVMVDCDCEIVKEAEEASVKQVQDNIKVISDGGESVMVYTGLIPEARKDDEYTTEYFKANVSNEYQNRGFNIKNSQQYTKVLESLCGSAIAGERPRCSYLITSPNGFSKNTLANTCIKYMSKHGMKCMPYVSLARINEMCDIYEVSKQCKYEEIIRVLKRNYIENKGKDNDISELEKVMNEYGKLDKVYTWNDVVTCDVLYTYFSQPYEHGDECMIAMKLLSERSAQRLPTIIMSNYSLSNVKNKDTDAWLFIRDFLSYSNNDLMVSMDKLKQVSCIITSKDRM